jgi:hypothetical protein
LRSTAIRSPEGLDKVFGADLIGAKSDACGLRRVVLRRRGGRLPTAPRASRSLPRGEVLIVQVHVIIEISGSAWSTDPLDLPEDTRQALETDGRTELLKVLDRDDPPPVIRCGPTGCAD